MGVSGYTANKAEIDCSATKKETVGIKHIIISYYSLSPSK